MTKDNLSKGIKAAGRVKEGLKEKDQTESRLNCLTCGCYKYCCKKKVEDAVLGDYKSLAEPILKQPKK
ncbi:hypothetical protein [Parashewanella tropica]|uniref:hypothetical protein n=1 Tax=Parashewanella tropica TaxID=2547970 RepID=UPI0010599C95|nr:hypothetical protein [Parashewanella tropica]